jgi:putative Holliday junction resolvase
VARLLGIDPGSKRCGIAITDSQKTMAFPRPALQRDANFLVLLAALIDEESIGEIVIGRPVALSGSETASTKDATALFDEIRGAFASMSVIQWDERLTTHQAQKSLSEAGLSAKDQRARIDSAAAVVMLQNYVDGLTAE